MASVPHSLGEGRATVPTIVLPLTSRGLVLTDRVCWGILGAAMAAAAALILYLNRGTTFFLDELPLVYNSSGLEAGELLEPSNGHLGLTTRLYFKAILETFGADYVVFRVVHVVTALLAGALFYALAKRRIGALPALAPTLVVLFLGSAWVHVLTPQGFGVVLCVAAGLGALLCLERSGKGGDAAACALIILSVATYTIGLAFLVGAAISVLLRPDRRRRAWIFLIPLALYIAWWLGTQDDASSSAGEAKLSNVLLIPNFVADSLAFATAAVSGLGYDFAHGAPSPDVEPGWGMVVGTLAVIALALRIRRGGVPVSLWVSLGIVLAYWSLGALVTDAVRTPGEDRYVYMGVLGVLLVATDAARSIRFSKPGLLGLFAACAISLATNIAFLRDGATYFRDAHSTPTRAQFAMLELARDRVDPDFDPGVDFLVPVSAATYFTVVDHYGSLGLPLPELERESEPVREQADQTLAAALGLRLKPTAAGARGECREERAAAPGGGVAFELPTGGASLRATDSGELTVGQFGSTPSARVGSLSPRETSTLRIPADSSPKPWHASVTAVRSMEVCRLR
jgi:hypothetical protein